MIVFKNKGLKYISVFLHVLFETLKRIVFNKNKNKTIKAKHFSIFIHNIK